MGNKQGLLVGILGLWVLAVIGPFDSPLMSRLLGRLEWALRPHVGAAAFLAGANQWMQDSHFRCGLPVWRSLMTAIIFAILQRQPARGHAVGPVLGPHARTDRTRDTRDAEPWLPAPEHGRPGEGQRLTPGAPHNGGRPPPAGTAPHHPRGMQPPQGMQAAGRVLGSHTHTPAPTACGCRTQTARPVGGQSGEGQRLTPDAPHNGGRHPPRDDLPPPPQRATPACKGARCGAGAGSPRPHQPHPGHTGRGTLAARSRGRAAGGGTAPDTRRPSQRWQATRPRTAPHHPRGMQPPQGMQAAGTVLGSHAHTPAPTARGWRTPSARPVGGQLGEGRRLASDAPHNGGRHPPGDALPPPPQRATPARKGARCEAGAGSPRPHRPHPGHTGRGTLAARSRGRAAGGGTAPDTRRPSQRWQATPPGDGPPPPPRHAAPTGHAGQGDSVGPPHPHTRTHSTWVADPNSPPNGWAVGGGTAPDPRRPSQWWKAPPPGTPFRHSYSEQRRPARATLWGLSWVTTPTPTAPGTHGTRNPGCPLQRTGGWGRDSA